MKKWILSALMLCSFGLTAFAQKECRETPPAHLPSSGELFQGMSRAIPDGRVVLPYGLEEDGSFYSYNVKYAEEPEKLNVEMKDFLSPTEGRLPSNRADIYFKELGNESPILVKLMMESIYKSNKRIIKHIGVRQFGMRFLLRGLYAHNGLLYFHTRIDNETNMPYSVDFITFKVVDKKVAKRTAIQEHVQQPLRAYHQIMWVKGQSSDRSIFALEQFALSEDKQLEVTLYERNGGRTLSFYVQNEDLLLARRIDNLKLKW